MAYRFINKGSHSSLYLFCLSFVFLYLWKWFVILHPKIKNDKDETKTKYHPYYYIIIEAAIVLFASIVSFWVCEAIHLSKELTPLVLLATYVLMKISYLVCTPWIDRVWHKQKNLSYEQEYGNVLKRRMELFHYEYQIEEQSYLQRKEKANDLKMAAIMKYTRDTFKCLNFDEIEVFANLRMRQLLSDKPSSAQPDSKVRHCHI